MTRQALDVHAHAWLPDVHAMVADLPAFAANEELERRRAGSESAAVTAAMVQSRVGLLTDVDFRLDVMDRSGITAQLVSVSPTQYYPWAAEALAWDLTQALHDGVSTVCAKAPSRLAGLGVVALQHPHRAVEMLRDAVLRCGLKGVEISTFAPDPRGGRPVDLSDPRLEQFWATAVELEAAVLIHPWGCSLDERLDRWYLANSVGQPVEHAVALSHLIFGGVLDRHPGLRIIAAHGGGYLPGHLGRCDHAWRQRIDAAGCANLPSSYLRQLYFDSLVHSPRSLRTLIEAAGPDRVLLGSDFPFDMGSIDPLGDLRSARLTATDTAAIAWTNATRLGLIPSAVLLD